jgi:DNA-binding GntR family transcriptional regulator
MDQAMIETVRALPTPSFRALSQHATQALREAIINGHYRPGDRLVERELAAEMNVSRAPVREALWLLSTEGLITLTPHRGAVVAAVSREMVIDVFSVRAALEGMAGYLAAGRIGDETLAKLGQIVVEMEEAGRAGMARLLVDQDMEFHRLLASACDRPVLLEALEVVWNKSRLLINASRSLSPLSLLSGIHGEILEAARSGDPDRLQSAIREHLAFGERTLLDHL